MRFTACAAVAGLLYLAAISAGAEVRAFPGAEGEEGEIVVDGEEVVHDPCQNLYIEDASFESANLSTHWNDQSTGPLQDMLALLGESAVDPLEGFYALRFIARDTDDVHAIGQTVTLDAGSYELTLQARRENAEVSGSISIALGETAFFPSAAEFGGVTEYQQEAFSFEVEAAGEYLLVLANPSLTGGDVYIDNVCIHPAFPGDGEGNVDVDGEGEGVIEGGNEGSVEGEVDGEGSIEGYVEGTEDGEGDVEGVNDGEGEGAPALQMLSADWDGVEGVISLTELLRVIQFYNANGFACAGDEDDTEDGFVPGPGGDKDCPPHTSDYIGGDWLISLSELLRLIQIFNAGGYEYCPESGTDDGFCPVAR